MQDLVLYLTKHLAEVLYVFTQSDEIILLVGKWKQEDQGRYLTREFNGRRDKLVSLAAGLASSRFYALCAQRMMNLGITERLSDLPQMIFDARMAQYATMKEAFELILRRSYDSGMNGVMSGVAFGPELPGKKQAMADNGSPRLKYRHDNGLSPLTNHQAYESLYKMKMVDVEVTNKLTGAKSFKKKRKFERPRCQKY